jgi:hypothetical protein
MGCLLKTIEKKYNSLKKTQKEETKTEKTNEKNKDMIDNDIEEENQNKIINENNNNINININKSTNQNNKNKSKIKNKDNYFTPEQLEYYSNIYLLKYMQVEPSNNINFKK